MRWIVRFALLCAALIILGLMAVWGLEGFESLGVEGHVAAAMLLGIFFTILVSVVLMGLIFYSHRSGHDSAVHEFRPAEPRETDASPP